LEAGAAAGAGVTLGRAGRSTTSEMDRDLLGLSEETLRLLELEPPSDMGQSLGGLSVFWTVRLSVFG
jgi:hypothetical protein